MIGRLAIALKIPPNYFCVPPAEDVAPRRTLQPKGLVSVAGQPSVPLLAKYVSIVTNSNQRDQFRNSVSGSETLGEL